MVTGERAASATTAAAAATFSSNSKDASAQRTAVIPSVGSSAASAVDRSDSGSSAKSSSPTLDFAPALRGFAALLRQEYGSEAPAAATRSHDAEETQEKGPAQALLSLLNVKRAAPSDSDDDRKNEENAEDDDDDDENDGEDEADEQQNVRDGGHVAAHKQAAAAPSPRTGATNTAPRPKKKRKSTHTARKEEMAQLQEEIRRMSAKLAFLRGQVFAPGYAQQQQQQHPSSDTEPLVVPPQVSNAVLRHSILNQQLHFASARSMMSQFISSDLASPLHSMIHLPRPPIERRAILLAVKPSYIEISRRFMDERCRFIDPLRPHACTERFVTPTGDACCIRFYVEPFDAAFSVREVFDAITYYMLNLELHITESAGHITIREDDDSGDPGMSQHRLVSTTALGAVIETNVVVFSQYDPETDFGICTATYVDRDDLHPYRPLERVRQDVTAVLTISREGGCAVLRRWAYVRVHHPRAAIVPRAAWLAIQENVGQWGDAMVHFLREHLHIT